MTKDIIEFVKRRKNCQLQKLANRYTKKPMIVTTTAFERISLEISKLYISKR